MRVLFLSNIPSPYRVDFFNELGKLCDLTVVFEGVKSTERDAKWKGASAEHFNAIFLNGLRTGHGSFLCLSVKKWLKLDWDYIILGGYATPTQIIAINYLKRKKKKFYIEVDGGSVKSESKFMYNFKSKLISSASGWFSTGKSVSEYLIHYGARQEDIYLYPFTSLLKGDFVKADMLLKKGKKDFREKLGVVEDKIILSVGRFSYMQGYGKGYDILMRVAEKLPDSVGIYIVGDNPTEEFENWKKEKNLEHVHFVGFKTKDELANYYAMADLFIMLTRGDVWGLVINESMMYALPVISSNKCVAGVELMREDENGYIVDNDNEGEILDKINYILSSEERLGKFSEKSREIIENYTIENMAKVHYEILTELDKKDEKSNY